MKKYSSREKRLLNMMIFVVVVGVIAEVYDRFSVRKQEMLVLIDTEKSAQDVYWQKLDVDEDKMHSQIEQFDKVLNEAEERLLQIPVESDAIFKVQELLSDLGEKAKIGMNSQNKRKSNVLSEEKNILELRTYFGYDCSLEDMLVFFDMLKEQPYYFAVDTLNINSYSRRRSRRPSKKEDPNIDRIRGSMVISTLFTPGEGEFIANVVEPRPRISDEEPLDSEDTIDEPDSDKSIAKVEDDLEDEETHEDNTSSNQDSETNVEPEQLANEGPPPISDVGKLPPPKTRPLTSHAQRLNKIKALDQPSPSKSEQKED